MKKNNEQHIKLPVYNAREILQDDFMNYFVCLLEIEKQVYSYQPSALLLTSLYVSSFTDQSTDLP